MAFLLNGALVLRGRYDLFIHRFLIPKYPECNNLRLIYFFSLSNGGNSAILRVNGSKRVGFPASSPEVTGAGKGGGIPVWGFRCCCFRSARSSPKPLTRAGGRAPSSEPPDT